MTNQYYEKIAKELKIKIDQVEAVAKLLAEDATVPFIARYRKEVTGALDEVQITAIRDRLQQLAELDKRREAILKSLTERELLTDELKAAVEAADNMATLEDVYLPYRPKRRTRAQIAREKGLEPLAELLLAQDSSFVPDTEAAKFIDAEKKVESAEDALAGARDIIAEMVSENPEARQNMRELFEQEGVITSAVVKGKDEEGAKFRDYFDWNESLKNAPGHRVLAMFRGENEGLLKLSVRPSEVSAKSLLDRKFVKGKSPAAEQVHIAVEDCYDRLLAPSLENEVRAEAKKRADEEAIQVFAKNLRELLMAAPLGSKSVLGIDPGFRTGCKVVVLDPQGKLLHDTVIYPTQSERQKKDAAGTVTVLCDKFNIDAVAIGTGTASRETEEFVRSLDLPKSISIVMVNESGASIYSASAVAREEFPDKDLTVRGAVSIGRRLMDPLAELVKLDPKSVGVGQYQHDVDQSLLKSSLDDTVMSCVNSVGVEVNTASKQLLSYTSGLGPALAANIVKYRDENGPFKSRSELKKVSRLGPKAFEQSAGFLRIRNGKNPLDSSAVHPESYKVVDQIAKDLGCSVTDLMKNAELRARVDLNKYVTDKVGLLTLNDIMSELAKPGRDPREKFEAFSFDDRVHTVDDLQPGMKLPGIVTNVTNFGAFVDIGVHQDGLVHISELADQFVNNPADVVKVQQKVSVTVMEVDKQRNRISLSMRSTPETPREQSHAQDRSRPPANNDRRPRGGNFNKSKNSAPQKHGNSKPADNWLQQAIDKNRSN